MLGVSVKGTAAGDIVPSSVGLCVGDVSGRSVGTAVAMPSGLDVGRDGVGLIGA